MPARLGTGPSLDDFFRRVNEATVTPPNYAELIGITSQTLEELAFTSDPCSDTDQRLPGLDNIAPLPETTGTLGGRPRTNDIAQRLVDVPFQIGVPWVSDDMSPASQQVHAHIWRSVDDMCVGFREAMLLDNSEARLTAMPPLFSTRQKAERDAINFALDQAGRSMTKINEGL